MLSHLDGTFEISLYEIFAFLGMIQSVFILVYIGSRSWRSSRSIIPFLYFLMLGGLFYLEFLYSFLNIELDFGQEGLMFLWLLLPIISYLLIIQIINLETLPSFKHYWTIFIAAAGFLIAFYIAGLSAECGLNKLKCTVFYDALIVIFILISSVIVALLFVNPNGFRAIRLDKAKAERYWLSLTIILINTAVIATVTANAMDLMSAMDGEFIRIILGTAYVYLATTSLFRIYPPALPVEKIANPDGLTASEKKIAEDIDRLMTLDKLYQEAAFSRADMARELNVSEGVITKVINAHYGKSFPTLINEARIKEAKHLLIDTDVNIKTIAEDVGFNSIATFNRVFKDVVGQTATEYRANKGEKADDTASQELQV